MTTALRDRELRPDLERVRLWADEIGVVPLATVRCRLGSVNELLMTRLLPHALAEDEILYPAVGKFVGAQDEIVLPVLDARCTLVETADLTSAMERAAARFNAEA